MDQEAGGGTRTLTWPNGLDGIFVGPSSESSYDARDAGGLKRKNRDRDEEDKAIGVIRASSGIAKRKHTLEGPGRRATQAPLSAADTTGFQSERRGSDESRSSRRGTGSGRASVANLVEEGGAGGVSKPPSNPSSNGTSSTPKIFLFSKFIKTTRPSCKLFGPYLGPFEVIDCVGTNSIHLRLTRARTKDVLQRRVREHHNDAGTPPSPNVSITTITTTTVQSPSTAGSGHSNSTLSAVGVSAPGMSVASSGSAGSGNGRQNGASPSRSNLTSASPETKSIHLGAPLLQLQVLASNTPSPRRRCYWACTALSGLLNSSALLSFPHGRPRAPHAAKSPPAFFLSHAPSTSPPFVSTVHYST